MKKYQEMFSQSIIKFSCNEMEIDPYLAGKTDGRRGVTLLARIKGTVADQIGELVSELDQTLPHQYAYPRSDLHLTVLSILTCHEGFDVEGIAVNKYIEQVADVLRFSEPLKVYFRGITASPGAVMVCGYPQSDSLATIRGGLRESFKNSELAHSIDARYTIETAHSTVFRFCRQQRDLQPLINLLNTNQHRDFGLLAINELELVENDWYQRAATTRVLARFSLSS